MTRARLMAVGLAAALVIVGTAAAAPAASAATATYTKAQVRQHKTATDCWTWIGRNVYNLTTWVNRHPGGSYVIQALCGKSGTVMFNSRHGYDPTAKAMLATFKIGRLA